MHGGGSVMKGCEKKHTERPATAKAKLLMNPTYVYLRNEPAMYVSHTRAALGLRRTGP